MSRTIELSLFGAFRDYQSEAQLQLSVSLDASIAEVRQALNTHGKQHWPQFSEALLMRSAFATEKSVLQDSDALPPDGKLVVLPPVAGG